MATHRALVLKSTSEPLSLDTIPIPTATSGAVVVRVLGSYILPYLSSVVNGTLPYSLSLPMIPGANCIAHVHAVGPDSISLTPGQLVLCDITVRARDDPNLAILMGLEGSAAKKLMEGEWRDGSFAEYAKFPLENVFSLDEDVLLNQLGYSIEDLCSLPGFLVPYGGLSEIEVKPGDTVIVAPSTGRFGGGAVTMALAMGATVVACGRNEKTLNFMKETFEKSHPGRLRTVILTGDVEADTKAMIDASSSKGKGADAYIDFSPSVAAKDGTPSYIQSALGALRPRGRAAFMGGIFGKVEIPYFPIVLKSLRIQGRFMYEREMVVQAIKMIEKGNLKLGKVVGTETVGVFGMEQINEAMELAAKESGWGKQVVLRP